MKNENGSNHTEKHLNDRLASLETRLEETRKSTGNTNEPNNGPDVGPNGGKPGFGNALKMSSEFISAILVGAMIGYLIDSFAGTTPWAMIFMLLLGFVAGVINVLRSSGEMSDPYQAGWASSRQEQKDQKVADKALDDLYDDEDDE